MEAAGSAGRLRRARSAEADQLNELALRSKGHWGYGSKFLQACRAELTLEPECIDDAEVIVLEVVDRIVGFYTLVEWDSDLELGHFFVDPPVIGQGVGRLLWEDAVKRARGLGFKRLLIRSDPHAEGFYRKLGAERIGEVPSAVSAGRVLPLLLYTLTDGATELRQLER